MMRVTMATRTPRPKRVGRYHPEAVGKEIVRLIEKEPRGTHAALSRALNLGHPAQLTVRLAGKTPLLIEQLGAVYDFFAERGYDLPEGWPLVAYRGRRH